MLRLLDVADDLPLFAFNPEVLNETQKVLERRRRKVDFNGSNYSEGSGKYHSSHALTLRLRLANEFHDSMSTFLVCLNSDTDKLFCQGTGFATFPASSVILTMLNVSKVPAIVVVDSTTGRPLSADAALAVEWNEPQDVINAWEAGKSGLSASQKTFSTLTFQGDCAIS
eukprot:scaffold3001_cov122-Cylindrotheca_fusiformis.AAC.6